MDSNKDEGVKCMAIGKAALEAGDRTRAVKFFSKAQRLYPNPQVDAYLSALHEGNGKQAADEKHAAPPPFRSDSVDSTRNEDFAAAAGIRQQQQRNGSLHRAGSSTASAAAGASGADASAEQIEIVARIKRSKKDYYQILGVTRECSDEDVRKAYRKISLKVHPDKNKAAGAEEAFKLVSRAFSTLSDTELREKYDRYGPEEDQQEQQQQQQNFMRRRRNANGGGGMFYEDMFEANDVFNSFFFGGMQPQPGGGFRRAHFTRGPGGGGGGGGGNHSNNLLGLLQLLPILALFLFSYFPFSQPVYQLEKQEPYHYMHKTRNHAVTFFVKSPDFNTDYPVGSSSRRTVEAQVERDYKEILIHNCRIEQSYYRWGQRRETPNCDKLQRFGRVI